MNTIKVPVRAGDFTLKRTLKFFLPVLFLTFSFTTRAQEMPSAMTGLGIQQLVSTTINNLTNAATTLLGNGSIVINGASGNISALLNQFNTSIKDNVSTPLAQLSDNVKNLGNQLFSVCTRLNTILTQQQSCLLLNAQVVIASVQTVTSEIKNGIPFISKDSPRLSYFQFDGHSPTIVPQTGGRVNIIGYDLWPGSVPPVVTIYDEARSKVLMQITPNRSENNNSFSFLFDAAKIDALAGQTLQVEVEPKEKVFGLFVRSLGKFYLPISLPSTLTTELKIVAHAQYTYQKDTTAILDYRDFNFDNSSCGNKANVSHTETWVLPQGASILSVSFQRPADVRNDNNINVTPVGSSITAAGWIDAPTCFDFKIPPFGPTIQRLFHSAFWHASIAPKIGFKKNVTLLTSAESAFVKMDPQTTNLFVNLSTPPAPVTSVVFWFDIIQQTGNTSTTLYSSAKSSGSFADDWKGLSINAVLNTASVNSTNELQLKISQAQCGF